ncbi:LacI family DNA-binding transcriptional regulator [Isoptericola nanjingensis]|uniref:LacI family DNA-binding transcriptional regulator n=1 Tax=Isoptericola nanjingensis TaxID=903413 RepID=UPI003D219115
MARTDSRSRKPTMIDVANLAGVSHMTVSRYLRDDPTIREENRARIATAIEELEYRPNLVARAMRTRRTGRVAVVLPAGGAVSSVRILAGAGQVAQRAGFDIEVITLGGAEERRTQRLHEITDSGLFEGVLCLTPLPVETRNSETPLRVTPVYDEDMRSIGELAGAAPLEEIVEHLARQGHRHFLHVGGSYRHMSARERRDAYLRSVARLHLNDHGVIDGDWSAQSGVEAVMALPGDTPVTAIIAANDEVAAGVVHACRDRGWRVPDDISVTGWDDNPLGAWLDPALTTVHVDQAFLGLGRLEMAELLRSLGRDMEIEEAPTLSVIWRNSTAAAPTTIE